MNNREIVYESFRIIEDSLGSASTIHDIADRLGYSVFYFIRLFSGITGMTPKAYLNRRRITCAFEELSETSRKVIDVALDYGFGTPESFSRAFQKQLGILPSQVSGREDIDRMNLQPPLTRELLESRRLSPRQEPELVLRQPLNLIGLSILYNDKMPEDLSDPWRILTDNTRTIESRKVPERYYQVQYWLPNQDFRSIFFFIALEADNLATIPMQFSAKTLPGQHYLKFLHRGPSNQVGRTYDYIYSTYLPDTRYRLPHLFNFEYYPPDHRGPYDPESVSEIYIPVSLPVDGRS